MKRKKTKGKKTIVKINLWREIFHSNENKWRQIVLEQMRRKIKVQFSLLFEREIENYFSHLQNYFVNKVG